MPKFKASQIPLGVDVWDELEAELSTGFTGVYRVEFNYSAYVGAAVIVISYLKHGERNSEVITVDNSKTTKLVTRLCERFNIEWENITSLAFKLKPGELPIFNIEVYPFVNDESTLDKTKSRMSPKTID